MIEPGTYNISLTQGANYDRTFTVSGLNLTGYTAAMQVRESFDYDSTLISLTSGSGITLGGTAGTIVVAIPNATTAGVAVGHYAYDLFLTSGTVTYPILKGDFEVTGRVTR